MVEMRIELPRLVCEMDVWVDVGPYLTDHGIAMESVDEGFGQGGDVGAGCGEDFVCHPWACWIFTWFLIWDGQCDEEANLMR